MLAWSCLRFAWSDALSSTATFTGAGSIGRGFPSDFTNRTDIRGNLSVQCMMLLPPPYGSYYIEKGTGLSLGSIIVYWCRDGYQLVGSEKLACLLRDSTSDWSHPAPHCEAIPKPLDKGFRVAVIASLISGVIILTMSVSFAACCLRDRLLRNSAQQLDTRKEQQHGRTCRGARQADSTNKETEKQGGAFGKLKHHRRLDYRISALRSSVYPGALAGCSNQGFQSMPEACEMAPFLAEDRAAFSNHSCQYEMIPRRCKASESQWQFNKGIRGCLCRDPTETMLNKSITETDLMGIHSFCCENDTIRFLSHLDEI
ncbi:hypothetical protein KIL84_019338 [Mauremys mutica]|uniref:Sushi domain-containing protein n=1 Tax=Mauremys mutica TaxID=74926 RepID=A0A9D3XTM4_9SAUR|nr:hypothetical protein KIL84_019338 [Mauremys mutica]